MTDGKFDKRRRQWAPISVTLPMGDLGTKLKKKYGRDGVLTWVCFLLACKRNWIQGEFEYVSEADGWTRLGLGYPDTPVFTLEAFFKTTGALKQTSKRRAGEVVKITCSRWEEWQQDSRREFDAERKSSKRASNARTVSGHSSDVLRTLDRTDIDLDYDNDKGSLDLVKSYADKIGIRGAA